MIRKLVSTPQVRIGNHIRANVVGYVALFFALSLGTAWAVERNSVKSKHIANGQVKAVDTNRTQVQARVGDGCAPGTSIRAIAENGTVTCETVGGGGAGGAPSGPAGGDLMGSYPNPLLAGNTVQSTKVVNNSLIGEDINESTLGPVPSATQGGLGRYGFAGSCDPETPTFIDCSTVQVPLTSPGRLLILGQVSGQVEIAGDAELALGTCRLEVNGSPILASATSQYWDEEDAEGGRENMTLIAVSDVQPGPAVAGVECAQNQNVGGGGAITYPYARVVAVALSGG